MTSWLLRWTLMSVKRFPPRRAKIAPQRQSVEPPCPLPLELVGFVPEIGDRHRRALEKQRACDLHQQRLFKGGFARIPEKVQILRAGCVAAGELPAGQEARDEQPHRSLSFDLLKRQHVGAAAQDGLRDQPSVAGGVVVRRARLVQMAQIEVLHVERADDEAFSFARHNVTGLRPGRKEELRREEHERRTQRGSGRKSAERERLPAGFHALPEDLDRDDVVRRMLAPLG